MTIQRVGDRALVKYAKRAKMLSRQTVLALLREACDEAGSQSAYAKQCGYTPAYLSDVLSGKRDPGPKILAPLGLEAAPSSQMYQRAKR